MYSIMYCIGSSDVCTVPHMLHPYILPREVLERETHRVRVLAVGILEQ